MEGAVTLALLSSALMGGAVGYLGWLLVSIAVCPRVVDPKQGFDEDYGASAEAVH